MGINIGQDLSKLTVYKDEQGRYKTYIKGNEMKENGEKEDIYMSKKIQFKKGVDIKNKSVIEVVNGWMVPYRLKTDEFTQEGKPKYKYFDKLFINEFNLLQEGTDENMKPKQQKVEHTEQQTQDDFSFYESQDDLPF